MSASVRSRGYLPHWETDNAIYFVTFRLADSLPRELVLELLQERKAIEKAKRIGTGTAGDIARLSALRAVLRKAERCLDRGLGACHMRDHRIAQIVADAIQHFGGKRYRLIAWCVMPNHVHVVFSPMGTHRLPALLHSWKSFSAQAANRELGRTGAFWQREYFDHVVRHEASLQKIVQYVQDNPRRAGLRDWRWAGVGSAWGSREDGDGTK